MLSKRAGAPSFSLLCRIPLCKCTIVFIHSFADGNLGCFQHLAIVNCASMNIGVHTCQNGHHKQINKQVLEGTLVRCWWECRLMQPLWKTVWNFLRKLKMELPFDPAILLLGLYPKNPETPIQKNLCTSMFIAAQFTIAKCWKQPKFPSANE